MSVAMSDESFQTVYHAAIRYYILCDVFYGEETYLDKNVLKLLIFYLI